MKVELFRPHRGRRAGEVVNLPMRTEAERLIREGAARAVEAADLHLNPPPPVEPEADPPAGGGDEPDAPNTPPKKGRKKK